MFRCFFSHSSMCLLLLAAFSLSPAVSTDSRAQEGNSNTNFQARPLKVDEIPSGDLVQSNGAVMHRLQKLENEIDTLNRAVYRGEKTSSRNWRSRNSAKNSAQLDQSNMEVRISQLESDMRQLTGRLENEFHSMEQIRKELSDLQARLLNQAQTHASSQPSSDVDGKAGKKKERRSFFSSSKDPVEPKVEASTTNSEPPSENISPLRGASLPAGDPATSYEAAFSKLKNGNYVAAQEGFSKFLSIYPNHSLSPNAKYWLGETYYVREKFTEAAKQFAEAYQKYPKGPKGPDNLLKLGMSLAGIGL